VLLEGFVGAARVSRSERSLGLKAIVRSGEQFRTIGPGYVRGASAFARGLVIFVTATYSAHTLGQLNGGND
jgi:hypothetical protein